MRESRGLRWARRIGLTLLTGFVAGPLYVMLSASLQPLADVSRAFRWIPRHVTAQPYRDAWSAIPLGHYLADSAIIAASCTALACVLAAPAAYGCARYAFRGRTAFRAGLVATQLLPGVFFLLPLFLLYAQVYRSTGFRLIATFPGLVLVDLTFALPFAVWMLTGWFASMPVEPEEAAIVDGAGVVAVFVRIALPAATPGIAAVGTFAFALSWGEVLFASVLTNAHTMTVAVGLPALSGGSVPMWNVLMAASIIAALPVLAAVLLLQPTLERVLRAGQRP
jgi:multiple sugar transport system permease protein